MSTCRANKYFLKFKKCYTEKYVETFQMEAMCLFYRSMTQYLRSKSRYRFVMESTLRYRRVSDNER